MNKLDDYHRHEALDRACMLSQIVATWLIDHPYIEAHPDLSRKAATAFEALSDLYQAIGVRHLPELSE